MPRLQSSRAPSARARRLLPAAVALAALAVASPARAQFGTNLITNGNAESGPGTTGNPPVPGFTVTAGNPTILSYATGGGFPGPTEPGPSNRGTYFFTGGNSDVSSAAQTFTVSSFAGLGTLINAGAVSYTLSGFLGGFGGQEDNATLMARFLGAGSTLIGSATIGPVTAADRNGATGLFFRTTAGALPTGTQSVQFVLTMTKLQGSDNDGYADNLSFVLANAGGPTAVAPEPSTWLLVGTGLAAVAGVARRRARA